MLKFPTSETLGGMIHVVSCELGYVFEFTGNQFEKMRCVCFYEEGGFICRKSKHFGAKLGRCVPGNSFDGNKAMVDQLVKK